MRGTGSNSKGSRAAEVISMINQILQILALLIAGYWAWWTWNESTAPSLTPTIEVKVELSTTWSRLYKSCLGIATVSVENVGQKKVSVGQARFILAKAEPRRLEANTSIRILGPIPSNAEGVVQGELAPFIFVHDFNPKEKAHQVLNFLMQPDEKNEYWFKAEFFDRSNKPLGFWYRAIEPCKKES
jgi:hypothetical protein